jgi:cytochrome c oxidase subunit 3
MELQLAHPDKKTIIPSAKILLWLAIASMVMLFAGLTSAYVVRQAEGNWTYFKMPVPFYISTALIVLSSVFIQWAVYASRKDQSANIKIALITTLGLGLGFVFTQFLAWTMLVNEGVFLVGNPSGSFVYIISGLHLAHLAGGILYLLYVITKAIRDRNSSENYLAVQLCATYWHFLGGLWIYLFVFLSVIR